MPTESAIISKIRSRSGYTSRVQVGVGDDAAVLEQEAGLDLIACCDLSVGGVHFRLDWATPRMIGRKALAVTLSDVAAMGATARFAMVSVALGAGSTDQFIDELFDGLFEQAEASGVSIVGGDTSKSPGPLFIDTTVIGECPSGTAVRRSGARPGDLIFVTGTLGGSGLGLKLLERGHRLSAGEGGDPKALVLQDETFETGDLSSETTRGLGYPAESQVSPEARREAIARHLMPEPRLDAGREIGKLGLATAMIDISDGLTTDLGHVLEESRCGAVIRAESIPIADCLKALAASESDVDPVSLALGSGEEYELLFTARPGSETRLAELAGILGLPITEIGEITSESGMRLAKEGEESILIPAGYEHAI